MRKLGLLTPNSLLILRKHVKTKIVTQDLLEYGDNEAKRLINEWFLLCRMRVQFLLCQMRLKTRVTNRRRNQIHVSLSVVSISVCQSINQRKHEFQNK